MNTENKCCDNEYSLCMFSSDTDSENSDFADCHTDIEYNCVHNTQYAMSSCDPIELPQNNYFGHGNDCNLDNCSYGTFCNVTDVETFQTENRESHRDSITLANSSVIKADLETLEPETIAEYNSNESFMHPVKLHELVYNSLMPNIYGLRLQVQSTLNISFWEQELADYTVKIWLAFG